MKADIIMNLVHDGRDWVASNDRVTARGRDMDELAADLRRVIAGSGLFPEGTEVTVRMQVPMDIVPHWMRQYNPSLDYFNRAMTIKV